MQYYQDFACCAAVPGNGLNKEYALHLLQLSNGDIKVRATSGVGFVWGGGGWQFVQENNLFEVHYIDLNCHNVVRQI